MAISDAPRINLDDQIRSALDRHPNLGDRELAEMVLDEWPDQAVRSFLTDEVAKRVEIEREGFSK